MAKWSRHLYQIGLPLGEDGKRVTASKEHIELSRKAASEGIVLLKNDNNLLPLKKSTRVALFGKGSIDYVKGGGGSGDVTIAYQRSLYDGLKLKESEGKVEVFEELSSFYKNYIEEQYSNKIDPGMTEEPELSSELLDKAFENADVAIITICRFSGEGWDRIAPKEDYEYIWEGERLFTERIKTLYPNSDFMLTDKELAMVNKVKSKFKNIVVVLNIGGVMETKWIRDDASISSAIHMWQGGIEGGLAAADILVGDVNPSGKLVDTFTNSLNDYPSTYNFHDCNDYVEYTDDIYVGYRYFETIPGAKEKVIYPFGYGLSYSTFDIKETSSKVDMNSVEVTVSVTNTGKVAGKEVVMLYYSAPDGILGKPSKELAAFAKTKLLDPNETQEITLKINTCDMASYDDLGKISKSSWILEKGTYTFFIGNNIRTLNIAKNTLVLEENLITETLYERLTPSNLKERMLSDGSMEKLPEATEKLTHSILPHMTNKETEAAAPCERGRAIYNLVDRKEIMFEDVASGKNTLDEFMAQLSIDELIHLIGGQKNQGVSNTFGVGNMPEYGVPNIETTDGPAGVRILPHVGINTTAWPCSTMLACSFNTEYAEAIGVAAAKEVKENNLGIWLAPAVNIHRTPMCGRNFEYYSEDPIVAGLIGSAVVKGVQSQNIAATVKHFAFNNKETNRKNSDSRVSERAAREIYLKAFEIIVKNANPWCIMTAYNKVNSIQCSENSDLINGILREEWGFDGVVMTDWWTSGEHYLETKAGNDLKMGNGYPDRVKYAYDNGEITKDEIYVAAKNILRLLLRID